MKVLIKKIKPNPDNPRIIKDDKFKKLVQSLKDFPEMTEVRPIVVNKEMMILGGNMRLKAMQEARWKEVPVTVVDWQEEKQKEFIIKDNANFGEWNWDTLANEWDEMVMIYKFTPTRYLFPNLGKSHLINIIVVRNSITYISTVSNTKNCNCVQNFTYLLNKFVVLLAKKAKKGGNPLEIPRFRATKRYPMIENLPCYSDSNRSRHPNSSNNPNYSGSPNYDSSHYAKKLSYRASYLAAHFAINNNRYPRRDSNPEPGT